MEKADRTESNIRRNEKRRKAARQKVVGRANRLFTPEKLLKLLQQQAQVEVDFARRQEFLRDPEGFAARQKLEEHGPFHHAFGSDCTLS